MNCFSRKRDKITTSRQVGEAKTQSHQKPHSVLLLEEQGVGAPHIRCPTLGIYTGKKSTQNVWLRKQRGCHPRDPKSWRKLRFLFERAGMWSYSL